MQQLRGENRANGIGYNERTDLIEILMSEIATIYVERITEGSWRIAGTRVSLDSVVHCYWQGLSPETICEQLPALSMEQVYGAIAYYLGNKQAVDDYLAQQDSAWNNLRATSEAQHGPLLGRLRKNRRPLS